MDDRTFDARVRALGTSANRRAVIAALGALAGMRVGHASAKRGKVRGSGTDEKVTICHYEKDTKTYTKISVSAKAAESHLAHHDDLAFNGCCSNNDCTGGKVCKISKGCITCASDSDCSSGQRCDGTTCVTCSGADLQCYWLGNSHGDWAWEPATWVGGGRDGCLAADSCASGGGCYAWMDSTFCRQ